MRQKIVAGNWKMNNDLNQSIQLISDINIADFSDKIKVIVFPSFVAIHSVAEKIDTNKNISCGAQNVHPKPNGAFTGEVSTAMLKSVGVEYVLIGHSERREYFNETEAFLKEKIDAVLGTELIPIFCCGEPLDIRNKNQQNEFVLIQLQKSLFHLLASEIEKCIIAYEPIWAIGTGLTASSAQAQEMHLFIRNSIADKYGVETANKISILYGGSCKADNAAELFSQPDVDGGLIGGASLKVNEFAAIINSFNLI
jgi:triosephosphate isomerase